MLSLVLRVRTLGALWGGSSCRSPRAPLFVGYIHRVSLGSWLAITIVRLMLSEAALSPSLGGVTGEGLVTAGTQVESLVPSSKLSVVSGRGSGRRKRSAPGGFGRAALAAVAGQGQMPS